MEGSDKKFKISMLDFFFMRINEEITSSGIQQQIM